MPAPLPEAPLGDTATALSPAQHRTLAETALALPERTERALTAPTHRALGRVVRDAVLFLLPGHPAHEAPTQQLVTAASDALTGLHTLQLPSGAFSGGDNVDSPPDTAFTINDLAWARTALAADGSADRGALLAGLDPLLEAVTPTLVHGGLHTPNHRWEIASALCRLWEALGDPAARERAEQWLAEGVDLQADGMFSERSANYAAHVSVPALLAMGRILQRPDLLGAADVATRRQADLTDAAGLVETLASRRQDQFERFDGGALHPWFRAHAARTRDPLTARAARRTAARADADALLTLLALGTEDPRVLGALPAPAADPTPEHPEVVELAVSGLVRADHGTSSTVLHGGTDTARLGRITSGTSSQPVLARFLGRCAGVRELRLSRDFFSLGPLRPGAPAPAVAPDGALRFVLEEEVGGEYFQPLPPAEQKADGEYGLEFNGRFAAAMSFSRRPVRTLTLRTTMEATLRADELALRWDFVGPTTPICLLLALEGLELGADLRRDGRSRHVLEPSGGAAQEAATAEATHRARCLLRGTEEQLQVEAEGDLGGRAFYDPGEAYSFLGASDEPAGDVLLIPASTASPLQLTLRIAPLG